MSVPWYLMAKGKGGGGYKTASGPIVSINEALAAPLRSFVANIDPVQDLHGYDNPWPAGGGKNKLDYSAFQQYANWSDSLVTYGAYATSVGNKGYLLSTISGTAYTISLGISSSSFPTFCYLCRANGSDTSERVYAFTTSSFGSASITFTAESGWVYYVRIGSTVTESSFATQMEKVSNAQLELGSTATAYAPYSNICPISGWSAVSVWDKSTYDPTANPTATIQLGDTYYGGTLDVTNGVLTVDRAMYTFDGSHDEKWFKSDQYGYFSTSKITGAINANTSADNFLSNKYGYENISNGSSTLGACLIWAAIRVRLADMSISLDSFKQSLSEVPMTALLKLATPITIPLTPTEISTLQGQNNLWADSGDVTVEYLASGGANPDLMKLAVAFMGKGV